MSIQFSAPRLPGNRTEELKKELVQQQLDQIGDDLRDVDAERDLLKNLSVP
jgi:hypothetical protein